MLGQLWREPLARSGAILDQTPNLLKILIIGLAELVGQAPASMREVLCVWSPQKPTNVIATELGNRKFTVAVLQPALAWLLDKEVKSKKKADIAQGIILGIERLLPDTCG